MKQILDRLESALRIRLQDGMFLRSFSGLDKGDQALFCAIIKSYSADEYAEIERLCRSKKAYQFVPRVLEYMSKPHKPKRYKIQYLEYKINEPVSALLKYYNDPRSGKVTYARTDLKRRFLACSRKEQLLIIKSFLESKNKSDREWSARQADIMWDKCFVKSLIKAFETCPSKSVSITAFRHLPIEYVKNVSILDNGAEVEFYTRLVQEDVLLPQVDDMDIFKYLIAVSHARSKVELDPVQIEKRIFGYLHRYICKVGYRQCVYEHTFYAIPLFRNMIEALGKLGMTGILLKILALIDYVFDFISYNPLDTQFENAMDWIENVWEIEGKERIIINHDDDLPLGDADFELKLLERRLSVEKAISFL